LLQRGPKKVSNSSNRQLVKIGNHRPKRLAFSFDGNYNQNAIYQKLLDLGILKEEEDDAKKIALLLLF